MIVDFLTTRREAVLVLGASLIGNCNTARAADDASPVLKSIEAEIGGRIGVVALDTRNGARFSYRGDERFAFCSSYKWLLAACILSRVDMKEITLMQPISYATSDLVDYSPITKANLAEGHLSVAELCRAAVEVSDNAAANLLLKLIGGPQGLTDYLRGQGDSVTRLDRYETALNTNIVGDPRDTTTPNAMIGNMQRILTGKALSASSRDFLFGWMKNSRTGTARLRAGLPADWLKGDKTGTGQNGAAVDNAIVWPPNRAPILIVSYLSGSTAQAQTLDTAHAMIGALIAKTFG